MSATTEIAFYSGTCRDCQDAISTHLRSERVDHSFPHHAHVRCSECETINWVKKE